MVVCGFMMGSRLFLLLIRSMYVGIGPSARDPWYLSPPTACEIAHGSTHPGARGCRGKMSNGQSTSVLGMLVVPQALQMRSSQL